MESESELESESVGSSDEEVTFALLRFSAVNVKPLHRSRSYPPVMTIPHRATKQEKRRP
jgi:hypothetical protein